MPRVHTAKAARDYPEKDIKKGEVYYFWSFFRGPKMMSKTPPRRSQTTGSGKLSNVYAAEEALQDAIAAATTPDDVASALREAADSADECIAEYEEAIGNLESGFPNGCPAIDETNEAKDLIEAWKEAIESAADDVEGLDATDYVDDDARKEVLTADMLVELGHLPSEAEVNERYAKAEKVEGFDDLTDTEQEAMLQAAQDAANDVGLDL